MTSRAHYQRQVALIIFLGIDKWLPKWQQNGWRKSDGKPVVNKQDFLNLLEEMKYIDTVDFVSTCTFYSLYELIKPV